MRTHLARQLLSFPSKMLQGTAAAALLIVFAAAAALHADPAALMPKPAKVQWLSGECVLNSATRIVYGTEAAKAEAETLASMLRPATGLPLAVEPVPALGGKLGNVIELSLDPKLDDALGKEGYRLEALATPVIRITAAAPAGLFYGGQTLRQLLPAAVYAKNPGAAAAKWAVPGCKIEDKPRFGWRGYMLDYSRHFLDVNYTKHLLDGMALHKLNVLHMHLADDDGWRIEIKKYPKLTEVGAWRGTKCVVPNTRPGEKFERYGGFFTQEQIRELVAYAAQRHIRIMPEIDLPGHSLALCISYPETCPLATNGEKSAQGHGGNVISPAKESNYAMIDDIIGELASLFPFEYMHIGGDEVNHNAWKDCPEIKEFLKREKIANLHDAQVYFTKRLEGILAKHHKQMIGWNEILNGKLRRSTAIMSWTGTGPGYQAARMGFPVVMSPGPHNYFDMVYPHAVDEPPALAWAGAIDCRRCYAFDPLGEKGLKPEESARIFGVHACLWAEMIFPWKSQAGWAEFKTPGEVADYKTFPRLCALSETAWTPQECRNYADFAERLGPHLLRLKNAGITFRVSPPEITAGSDGIKIACPFVGAEVRYTTDGSDPLDSPTAKRWDGKPIQGSAGAVRARTYLHGIVGPLAVGPAKTGKK